MDRAKCGSGSKDSSDLNCIITACNGSNLIIN